jgi:hydroxyacylglutathione hydrolase
LWKSSCDHWHNIRFFPETIVDPLKKGRSMYLKQFYLGCLAHASYLIGDETSKVGIVIDPQRDIDQYLKAASAEGFEIKHVFLTHFHADFVAGHLELQKATGATIHLGSKAQAKYDFEAMEDGATLEYGLMRMTILSTPGHTPEGISILLFNLAEDKEKPHAVFTGDTLFVGDVGRPDLMASVGMSATDLAGMMYDSLREKLMVLPDETVVYPAHGAGSMCGKNLGKETFTTIGHQRKFNYALQEMSREEFVGLITANQPKAPNYFSYDATLNKEKRPVLESSLKKALVGLSLQQVQDYQSKGAQLLDVRTANEFAQVHFKGSLNIGLGGKFASWSGSILSQTAPIVILGDAGQEKEAIMRLGRIGFDHVVGFLAGGFTTSIDDQSLLVRGTRSDVATLNEQLTKKEDITLLDVRSENEFSSQRIATSCNIPLRELRERIDEIPTERPVVIHCAGGYRSSTAMSLLRAHGIEDVVDVIGGINAWIAADLETVS